MELSSNQAVTELVVGAGREGEGGGGGEGADLVLGGHLEARHRPSMLQVCTVDVSGWWFYPRHT